MAKSKGNFSYLTDQDLYWDGVDDEDKGYSRRQFERDIKREIHKENKRYREFIEDTSDDCLLSLMRGEIKRK
jgi:hypothetical protein